MSLKKGVLKICMTACLRRIFFMITSFHVLAALAHDAGTFISLR